MEDNVSVKQPQTNKLNLYFRKMLYENFYIYIYIIYIIYNISISSVGYFSDYIFLIPFLSNEKHESLKLVMSNVINSTIKCSFTCREDFPES